MRFPLVPGRKSKAQQRAFEVAKVDGETRLPLPFVRAGECVIAIELKQKAEWHTRLFSPHVPVPYDMRARITTIAAGPLEFEAAKAPQRIGPSEYVRRVYDEAGEVLLFEVYEVQPGVDDRLLTRWSK